MALPGGRLTPAAGLLEPHDAVAVPPRSPGKASWSPCLIFQPLVISILRLAGDEVAVAFWLAGDEVAVAFWLAGDEVAVAFWLASNEVARALRPGIRRSTRGLGESGCCGQKTGGEKRKFQRFHRGDLRVTGTAGSPWTPDILNCRSRSAVLWRTSCRNAK